MRTYRTFDDYSYYISVNYLDDPTSDFRESYETDEATMLNSLMDIKGLYINNYLDNHNAIEYIDDDQLITVACPDTDSYNELVAFSKANFHKKSVKVVSLKGYKITRRR
jgi:hypothetical protein